VDAGSSGFEETPERARGRTVVICLRRFAGKLQQPSTT